MAIKSLSNTSTTPVIAPKAHIQAPHIPNYDPTTYGSKKSFSYKFKETVIANGGMDFWVLNKDNGEIYRFKGTQVSDYDVTIDLFNALEQEHVFTATFVIHMKDKITAFFDEVPGKVYIKKLECYRELYQHLNSKVGGLKSEKLRAEMEDKIDFIELAFPELLI